MLEFASRAWVTSSNSRLGPRCEQFQSCPSGLQGPELHRVPHSLHPRRGTLGSPALKQEAGRDSAAGGKRL